MEVQVTLDQRWLEDVSMGPIGQSVVFPAGLARWEDATAELICPSVLDAAEAPAAIRLTRLPRHLEGAGHAAFRSDSRDVIAAALDPSRPPSELITADIGIFSNGTVTGAWHNATSPMPLARIRLIGPGMRTWSPGLKRSQSTFATGSHTGAFSRYAGGLGGWPELARLQSLSFAVIGSSRTGSLTAHSLAKAGVASLTLIDPDRHEPHLADATDNLKDVEPGAFKVDATAAFLAAVTPDVQVTRVPAPVESPHGWRRAAACDVIVCTVDTNESRLAASTLAAAYSRPLLDIGTGIQLEEGRLAMGFDLRLVLGGRCLVCLGGLDLSQPADRPWFEQRAGSRRSLNSAASAQAMLMLESLAAGTLSSHAWIRGSVNTTTGQIDTLAEDIGLPPGDCPVCRSVRGTADLVERGTDAPAKEERDV